MDKDKRISYLEAEVKRLSETKITKEVYAKEIGKIFGEESQETKTYQTNDREKSYQGFKQFYLDLMMLKKTVLIELLEKLRNLDKSSKDK